MTATKWAIDPGHSNIDFRIKHLMISYVRGSFRKFSGEVYTNEMDFTTAKIDLRLDAASIDTRNEQRDEHLRGPEFLDAKNHREIRFKGKTIRLKAVPGSDYELAGVLTICGISKKILLDIKFGGLKKDQYGNEKAGFAIDGKVNRSDWGLNWNRTIEAGGAVLGEEVMIHADVELIKEKTE